MNTAFERATYFFQVTGIQAPKDHFVRHRLLKYRLRRSLDLHAGCILLFNFNINRDLPLRCERFRLKLPCLCQATIDQPFQTPEHDWRAVALDRGNDFAARVPGETLRKFVFHSEETSFRPIIVRAEKAYASQRWFRYLVHACALNVRKREGQGGGALSDFRAEGRTQRKKIEEENTVSWK